MFVRQYHRNVHRIEWELNNANDQQEFLLISDIHFDNPKCNRELLVRHLDYALRNNCPILINGDFFCLMQGKYDPRRSKKDIRPEHNVPNYLDAVIEEAVEWWLPYHHLLLVVGYGNHETAIIKNVETDPLQRFVDLINFRAATTHKVMTGGYGGWIIFYQKLHTKQISGKMHYFHGSGGGGEVTKGVIQNQRAMAQIQGADVIWMGHVHEMYSMVHTIMKLHYTTYAPILKDIWHIRTPAYKEEYDGRYMGWHVERGAPPKPLGCCILKVGVVRNGKDKFSSTYEPRFLQ